MTSPLLNKYRDWITAIGIAAIAFALRIWHLASIKGFIFDELYYAKDAHSLLLHGVELDSASGKAAFVVHPPVGKWLIAAGIKLFGFNEFGWRFSAAIIGTASVLLMYFTAKKLFNSYLLSAGSALLISLDGLHLVHSRTALLDIFLMFFLQCAFFALLYSQHWLTGIALGLALATKWTGLYYIVAYFLFVLYVDFRSHKASEESSPLRRAVRDNLLLRAFQSLILPILIYISSFIGWFINRNGWDRGWANNKGGDFTFVPSIIRSWWHYQFEILQFHTSLTDAHPYSANPWSWLILGRPTSFYYETGTPCGAKNCSQEVLALGTPLLWWSAAIALFIAVGIWIARREWKLGVLLLSVAAGYLPWFINQKRTTFYFYTLAFEPFLLLTLVYVASIFLNSARDERALRIRRYLLGVSLALIALNFLYFLPLYLGISISHASWAAHMWFPSWI
jgi:dolichyl-phosphate-mannose--protein O-mannosyl transferase